MISLDYLCPRVSPKWSKLYLQWKAFIKGLRENFLAVSVTEARTLSSLFTV